MPMSQPSWFSGTEIMYYKCFIIVVIGVQCSNSQFLAIVHRKSFFLHSKPAMAKDHFILSLYLHYSCNEIQLFSIDSNGQNLNFEESTQSLFVLFPFLGFIIRSSSTHRISFCLFWSVPNVFDNLSKFQWYYWRNENSTKRIQKFELNWVDWHCPPFSSFRFGCVSYLVFVFILNITNNLRFRPL